MATLAEAYLAKLLDGARHDERMGPDPVGFVYFDEPNYEDKDVRVGYISSRATAAEGDKHAHPVERFAPYIFPGNWGEPTFFHLIAAWDYLVAAEVGQIAAVNAEEESRWPVIRWMNGWDDLILADRHLMLTAAEKERKKALRKRSGLTIA